MAPSAELEVEVEAREVEPEEIQADEAEELELDDEPEPVVAARARAAMAVEEEPEVEQDLPPRPEPRLSLDLDMWHAADAEALMDRGAPFSPEEMERLHDFVTKVRGPAYWDTFRNRPDVSVLRHAEGALRHYQTVLARKGARI